MKLAFDLINAAAFWSVAFFVACSFDVIPPAVFDVVHKPIVWAGSACRSTLNSRIIGF